MSTSTKRSRPKVVRLTVDVPPDLAAELDEVVDGLTVPSTRSAVLRTALRRGLRSLTSRPSHHSGTTPDVRC